MAVEYYGGVNSKRALMAESSDIERKREFSDSGP